MISCSSLETVASIAAIVERSSWTCRDLKKKNHKVQAFIPERCKLKTSWRNIRYVEEKMRETAQSYGFDQKPSAIERVVQFPFAIDLLNAAPVSDRNRVWAVINFYRFLGMIKREVSETHIVLEFKSVKVKLAVLGRIKTVDHFSNILWLYFQRKQSHKEECFKKQRGNE